MNEIASRPYRDNDRPLLQGTLAGWIRASGGYYSAGHLGYWIEECLCARYPAGDLVRVWEHKTVVIGIEIDFLFETAFYVLTDPAYRGRDVEITMLRSAFETTRRLMDENNRGSAAVVTDVFSCDLTRIELLTRLGFEPYRVWDHIVERSPTGAIPPICLPDGFSIRAATMDDYAQLAWVRNEAFEAGWTPEAYRDRVMCKPGYRPECEILALAPDGQVAALTVIRLDPINKIGLFEPVATRPAFRRRGLARALMLHGLCEMKSLGIETARVEYEAANLPAGELYRRLGFQKRYETLGYQRQ